MDRTTGGSPRADGAPDALAALLRGEIELRYQPVLELATRSIAGFEALLRWDHPDLGPVDPAEFVDDLEHEDHGAQVDRWVLISACCAAATWPAPVQVSVNVHPSRFARPGLTDQVRFALQVSGLDPTRLCLELVERSPLLCHPTVSSTVDELRAMGVSLALDDFLVHYSSLGSLVAVPATTVKLDRSFVAPLNRGDGSPIAEGVVHLAHGLGLEVVAEGVETHAGEAAVRELGCHRAQGFLYSDAVPAARAGMLVRAFGCQAPSCEPRSRR